MSDWIRVKQGETLEAIARQYHVTTQRIEELNRSKNFDLEALDGKAASANLKIGMRDPDALVAGEKLRIAAPAPADLADLAPKAAATRASPAVKQLSDPELTDQLNAQAAHAKDVAGSDKSINDPLRLLAQQDPIAYAQQVVGARYGHDAASTEQLAQCAQHLRVDEATRQVKALMDPPAGQAAKPFEAIQLLDKAMNGPGVTTADERSELWKKAGEPYFTKAFFTQQLHDAASKSTYDKPDGDVGDWMLAFSKNAPAEASRTLLDVFVKHDFDDSLGPKFQFLLDPRDKANPALFRGLSTLVQRGSEIPGDSRADKVADWLLATPADTLSPTRLQSIAPQGVRSSIADGQGSRLAMALIDKAKGKPALAELREQLLTQTAQGGDDLRTRAAAARQAWQDAMPKDLRWALNYFVDGSDTKAVTHAVELYRASHPDSANAMDQAALKTSRDAADVYTFVKDSAGLDVGKDPATAGERELGNELTHIDDDKELLQGLQTSTDAGQVLLKRSGYGDQPLEALPVKPQDGLDEASQQAFVVRNGKNLLQQALQETTKYKVRNLLAAREDGRAQSMDSTFAYLKKVAPLYGIKSEDAGDLVKRAATLAERGRAAAQGTQADRAQYVEDLAKFNESLGGLKKTYGQAAGDFGTVLKVVNVATFATNITAWAEQKPGVAPIAPNVMVLGNTLLGARDSGSLIAQLPGVSNALGSMPAKVDRFLESLHLDKLAKAGELAGKADAFQAALGGGTFARVSGIGGMASLSIGGYEYMIQDIQHGDVPLATSDAFIGFGAGLSAAATAFGAEAPAAANPIGITLLAAGVVGRVSYKQYESVSKSNEMEPSKDPALLSFLQQLGFKKEVATHLLDQTHHGLSPMIALNAWAEKRGLSRTDLYHFLNSLPEGDVKRVVSAAHEVVDGNDTKLVDDNVAPQDKISRQWLGYLSETMDSQSVKPPLGTKVVTASALDGLQIDKAPKGASAPLASFTQLAQAYQDDLATVHYTGPDKNVIADRPTVLKQQALDQLFNLNPQYDRTLLDGNPNTPRSHGEQGLDPDAVTVGTRLNVGVGGEPPMT